MRPCDHRTEIRCRIRTQKDRQLTQLMPHALTSLWTGLFLHSWPRTGSCCAGSVQTAVLEGWAGSASAGTLLHIRGQRGLICCGATSVKRLSDMGASGSLKHYKNRAVSDGHGCFAWSKHEFSSPPPPPAYDLALIFKESSSWKLFSPSFSHFQSGFFLLADDNSRVNVISWRHLGEFISI